MKDEYIMNNILTLSKNMCEILVHACIESSNDKVKKTFKDALVDYINIQGSIYNYMEKQKWYQSQSAPVNKVNKLKDKFSTTSFNSN